MAKNTKKQVSNPGRPITAFFAKAAKSPSSPVPPSPSQSVPLMRNSSVATVDNSPVEKQALLNSNKSNSVLPKMASGSKGKAQSGAVSPRRSERRSVQPPSSMVSLKRSRTPDAQAQVKKHTSSLVRVKTPERRKSKFDTDSESDPAAQEVIYVKSPNPQPSKKARFSSPDERAPQNFPSTDIVPSSQSDEEELPTAPPPIVTVMSPKATTKLPTPHPEDDDDSFSMAVDVDRPVFMTPPSSASSSKVTQSRHQMITPPSSDRPELPPTPVALTQKTKTDKLIADIKARAYAKTLSSSSPEPTFNFQDELDSSDEEELPILPLPKVKASSSKDVEMHDNTNAGPSTRRSTRLSDRLRSGSPPITQTTTVPPPRPTKRKTSVPFAALLAEKRKAEKLGVGPDDFERAEQAAMKYGKDGLFDEMDGEEEEDDPLLWGPDISSLSIRNILNSNSRSLNETREGEFVPGSQHDLEGGKTIIDILEHDKAERRNQGTSDGPGISLWLASEVGAEAMVVDERLQALGKSPVIHLLNASLRGEDPQQTLSALNMCCFLSVKLSERAKLADFLCHMALSSTSDALGDAAYRAVEKFWSSSVQPTSSTIIVAQVLACIKRLGADPSILSECGWQGDSQITRPSPDRYLTLQRLINLVAVCARTNRLRQAEVTEIVLALMLIGMDSQTSPGTSRDIVQTIDLAVHCLSSDASPQKKSELALATHVLRWASSYQPVNKLRLLSLLSNGGGSSRRIAEFVAYCIITDMTAPTLDLYAKLPPLQDILDQLRPYAKSSKFQPGKFALHPQTNYVDLGFYISILSVALSDVKTYVADERQKKLAAPPTPKTNVDKPKTDLELLYRSLETLHSSISDGRATHLDRSRTKATVKQLSMNIYYQREFWLKNNQAARAKTLGEYFTKKA